MCEELGFPNFSKGEPINNLMREIKSQVRKRSKKTNGWKELLDFWPFSILIPSMLILIFYGIITQ